MSAVWLDGELLDEDKARVSPFDHALLTGDGVFEALRVYQGVPFAVRRHLERLGRSAAGLRLAAPPPEVLRVAMSEVITANDLTEGRVRITVTGGVGSWAPTGGLAVPPRSSPPVPWRAGRR